MDTNRIELQIAGLASIVENMIQYVIPNIKGGGLNNFGQFDKSQNLTQKEIEIMRTIKNVRKRKDGRYEWQKMINGVWYREIDSNLEQLKKKVSERKKTFKIIVTEKEVSFRPKKNDPVLYELCWEWYRRNKEGKIKAKSATSYSGVIQWGIAVS